MLALPRGSNAVLPHAIHANLLRNRLCGAPLETYSSCGQHLLYARRHTDGRHGLHVFPSTFRQFHRLCRLFVQQVGGAFAHCSPFGNIHHAPHRPRNEERQKAIGPDMRLSLYIYVPAVRRLSTTNTFLKKYLKGGLFGLNSMKIIR